jgi:hypothetical protein
MFQLLINLLFGLCKSMWIIDPFIIHPNLHPGVPTRPSTPEVLRVKECAPTPSPFIIFTFGFTNQFIKEFRGVSNMTYHLFHLLHWVWITLSLSHGFVSIVQNGEMFYYLRFLVRIIHRWAWKQLFFLLLWGFVFLVIGQYVQGSLVKRWKLTYT